jgi:FecR protein
MKNITRSKCLFALLSAMLLSLLAPPFAAAQNIDPPSRAGRVSAIEGAVLFYDEQSGWRDAVVNYPVTSQNSLATRGRSRVEVRVGSTALRIDDDSQLDLLGVTDNFIDARLAQGSLNMRVRNLDQGDYVRVSTPHTQAIIRVAGRYRIDADKQATRVTVLQGAAGVSMAGAPESVLYAGTSTVVGGNYNRQIETAQSDAFDDWALERDHRFERARSAQYVSPEMTGYEELDQYGSWRNDASYGNVWMPTNVASGWVPYQDGRWVHVQPWGWTWVDNAPWGFAPFHYGRWVQVNNYWAWSPGNYHARPVYAPALVAFVGDPGWNASFSFGNAHAVGWFPLGWGEPYRPYYHCSNTYIQNVNITHVHGGRGNHGGANYGGGNGNHNRDDRPHSLRAFTTVVPRDQFTRPIMSVTQAMKVAINQPVARTAPVPPPSSLRAIMTPAPGLNRNQTVTGRIFGQQPMLQPAVQQAVTPPQPAPARSREPQPAHDNSKWYRQPPMNQQPGTVQIPQPAQQHGRPVMNQPTPAPQVISQQNPQPRAPAPMPNEPDIRGHRPPPGMIHVPQQNPIVRTVEPVRPVNPMMQALPQPAVQPHVQQPAPAPAAKANSDSHRRQRESDDHDNGNRRMPSR